jgi:hypothetical protein
MKPKLLDNIILSSHGASVNLIKTVREINEEQILPLFQENWFRTTLELFWIRNGPSSRAAPKATDEHPGPTRNNI